MISGGCYVKSETAAWTWGGINELLISHGNTFQARMEQPCSSQDWFHGTGLKALNLVLVLKRGYRLSRGIQMMPTGPRSASFQLTHSPQHSSAYYNKRAIFNTFVGKAKLRYSNISATIIVMAASSRTLGNVCFWVIYSTNATGCVLLQRHP